MVHFFFIRQNLFDRPLENLKIPPGNCLEALKSDKEGQYSIRINDQYRICFFWRELGADAVAIVDYH
ncbi:type II toxin-antitoxin system RelE/ParE family toxin [Dolichospermum sp. FACHB-1091]|uniref:type II toxin-antitoxin system RelE/ParE family toxin n=1 Tax=Dolichospermum sp. FACHB-1091 TaxID=2692798 RepID=UPI00322095F2